MGTGAAVAPGQLITAAKMNLKLEDVLPAELDAIDAPADNEAATYDSATGRFEWQPAAGVTKHTDLTDKEVAGVIDHANLSVTPGKLSFGVWEKIVDVTIGVKTQHYNIVGLNGDVDKTYFLIIFLKNDAAATRQTIIRINNDAGGNYPYQYLAASVGAVSGGSGTQTSFNLVPANLAADVFVSHWFFNAKTGTERVGRSCGGRASYIYDEVAKWTNTASNVTSLDLISDGADALGVGTRIILFRLSV